MKSWRSQGGSGDKCILLSLNDSTYTPCNAISMLVRCGIWNTVEICPLPFCAALHQLSEVYSAQGPLCTQGISPEPLWCEQPYDTRPKWARMQSHFSSTVSIPVLSNIINTFYLSDSSQKCIYHNEETGAQRRCPLSQKTEPIHTNLGFLLQTELVPTHSSTQMFQSSCLSSCCPWSYIISCQVNID